MKKGGVVLWALLAGILLVSTPSVRLSAQPVRPQRTLSVKAVLVSFHPEKAEKRQFYDRKLSRDGRLTGHWGALLTYEQVVFRDRWALRLAAVGFSDCRSLFGGILHAGVHTDVLHAGPFTMHLGLGPFIYFREDWHRFSDHTDPTNRWSIWRNWQYISSPFGGDIEVDYRFPGGRVLSLTIIPALPEVVVFALGTKFGL